jgi:hypothetical protein
LGKVGAAWRMNAISKWRYSSYGWGRDNTTIAYIDECWIQLREYFKVKFYFSSIYFIWSCIEMTIRVVWLPNNFNAKRFFIVVSFCHKGRRNVICFAKVYKIVDFSSIQDGINSWWSTCADLRIICLGDHRY